MADHDTHDHTGIPGVGGSGIPDTILDAKGDIIAATAADTAARLAVGANDAILMAASGQSTGLLWLRTMRGRINADGTVNAGTGFTSANNSTGDYTVTITSAFAAVPYVFVMPDSGAGSRKAFVTDVTTGDFDLFITNFAGSNQDTPFDFLVIAV